MWSRGLSTGIWPSAWKKRAAVGSFLTRCACVCVCVKDHCTGDYNDGDWSILAEKKKRLYKEFALFAPAVPAGKRILMSHG